MIKIFALFLMLSIAIPKQNFSQSVTNGDYTLSIRKGAFTKQGSQNIWIIPTTLTNLSKDTLKYFSLRCSWQDFYLVDNEKLFVLKSICDKNTPFVLKLAPGKSTTTELKLLITPTMDTTIVPFKVGFNIIRANMPASEFKMKELLFRENVIWSNVITIKN
jgi:hypothetical protein